MPIFRNSKQREILNSRFRNYLFYAIGEVGLVVLGILIALWFNERGEDERIEKETKEVASLVMEQLKMDVEEIEAILDSWKEMNKTIDTILVQTDRGKPIDKTCSGCATVLLGVDLPALSERIPKRISETNLKKGHLKEVLLEIEITYEQVLKAVVYFNDMIISNLTKNYDYWSSNFDWFSDYTFKYECEVECETYFYLDQDYRNKVAYFGLILYESYLPAMESLLEFNQDKIIELKSHLDSK
ncbi:MAG: hypothetical protein AAGH46_12340 [Bacteroidota bacterium]